MTHVEDKSRWVDAHAACANSPETEGQHANDGAPFMPSLPPWFARAACVGEPVEVFVPDRGRPSPRALEMCQGCDVRAECLEFALAQPAWLDGLWAGTTPSRRSVLRRERRLSDPDRTVSNHASVTLTSTD